jgi:hypothetical protein
VTDLLESGLPIVVALAALWGLLLVVGHLLRREREFLEAREHARRTDALERAHKETTT